MIALQRRIDEGITAGRLTRIRGREFQLRLDAIRREFLQQIRDRPFTPEERAEISSRLDSLERDIISGVTGKQLWITGVVDPVARQQGTVVRKTLKKDIDFPFASGDLFGNRQIEFQHDPTEGV